jgi:hypothetical protein
MDLRGAVKAMSEGEATGLAAVLRGPKPKGRPLGFVAARPRSCGERESDDALEFGAIELIYTSAT